MQTLSDEQIMIALCCGTTCKRNGDKYCHRLDFANEVKRIRDMMELVVAERHKQEQHAEEG